MRRGGLAFVDQALIGVSNFLLSVLLARWLEPAEYGAFALALSAFWLYGNIYQALLAEPVAVFGGGRYASAFREYVGQLLKLHSRLAIPGTLCLVAASFALGQFYSGSVRSAMLGVALGSGFILLQSIMRNAVFSQLRPGLSAVASSLYFVTTIAGCWLLYSTATLSPATAFGVMAAAGAVSSAYLAFRLRPRWRGKTAGEAEELTQGIVAKQHWGYGRWLMSSAAVEWLPLNGFYMLLPAVSGLAAAANLRALMNLVAPFMHANFAISMLLVPRLVRDRNRGGRARMSTTIKPVLALCAIAAVAYLALLVAFTNDVTGAVYAGKYSDFSTFSVLCVGLMPLADSFTTVVGSAIRAAEKPQQVFWAQMAASFVTVAIGMPLAIRFGLSGALVGLSLAGFTNSGMATWLYLRGAGARQTS